MRPLPSEGRWARIQAKIDTGYAKAARVLGQPFHVYRPIGEGGDFLGLVDQLGTIRADFTNAKTSGFNYDRSQAADDMMWHGLFDGRSVEVGDYLVAAPGVMPEETTYFVAAVPPLKPILCLLCNRSIDFGRGNSQLDADGGAAEGLPSQHTGTGHYWGVSDTPDDDDIGPGERVIWRNVPVAMQALSGASRGQGQVPSDAPGPGRWRAWLPQSVFPKGSVTTRDIIVDDLGNRYQIMTDDWTPLGYKVEMIRLEN